MNLYRKLIPEKIRIKIRNIQYFFGHFLYKIKRYLLIKKVKKINKKIFIKKRPSIFYIIPTTKITGGVAVCCEHLNRLKELGYEVLFVSYDNKTDLSWFPNQKVRVIPLKGNKKTLENYDIGVATGWITAYELDLINVKRKIYFVQSDERRFYPKGSFLKKRVEETYKMPFEFITEAKWIKKWLKDEFNKNAIYIPNGVNIKIFHPSKPLIPKNKGKIRILVEGAANLPFKGVEESLKILNEIKKDLKNIEILYLNADGRPNPYWKYDYYLEKIPMIKMKKVYSSCDFMLKLSEVEGFPGPPLEMIMCGGKVIIKRTKGIEEYVNYFPDSFLVLDKIDKNKIIDFILKNKSNKNKKIKLPKKLEWKYSISKLASILKKYKYV
ncbi:MAG: hypothetical protein Fur009_6680 [Candidatus Microgenomates bacterium]